MPESFVEPFTPHPSRFTRRKAVIRIIRDVGKAWFSDTLRAGFACAHSAPFRKAAFTLAEVLITLGIIGVVAAMTLPALVANYKNKVLANQTKKTYATLLNAMNKWQYEMGASDYSGIFIQSKTQRELGNEFFSYLKIIKKCPGGQYGCMADTYKFPKARNDGQGKNATQNMKNFQKAILADGSSIGLFPYVNGAADCGRTFTNKVTDSNGNWVSDGKGGYETTTSYSRQCGVLIIDANGLKGPNQLGADAYSFIITNKKIANWHTQIDSAIIDESLNYVNYDSSADFQ